MVRSGHIQQTFFEPVGSHTGRGIRVAEDSAANPFVNFIHSSYNSAAGSSGAPLGHGPRFGDPSYTHSQPQTQSHFSTQSQSQFPTQSETQVQPQTQSLPQPNAGACGGASVSRPRAGVPQPAPPVGVAPPEMGELQQLMALELQQRCSEQHHADLNYQTIFHSTHIPSISMWDYVRRIAKYSGCTPQCFIFSMILIDRYCAVTGIPTTFRNIHRLSITAVMISAKLHDDVYYSNAYYASIGGVSNRELNHLEMELLATITWSTWVEPSHYNAFLQHLKQVYGSFISPQKSQ